MLRIGDYKGTQAIIAETLSELVLADVSEVPFAAFARKLSISADINGLARSLAGYFNIQSDPRNLSYSDLEDFRQNFKSSLAPEQMVVLELAMDDIREIRATCGKIARLKIVPHKDNDPRYHPDEKDRVLCPYNMPTTKGLIAPPTAVEESMAEMAAMQGEPDPLALRDSFSIGVMHMVKMAGRSDRNRHSFWHLAVKPDNPDGYRVLLVTDLY